MNCAMQEDDVVSSLYDQLGGEGALRAIIDRFVDRVFEDAMIGFFFAQASRERIKDKEFEFAAQHLGGPFQYTGRPLQTAHARHPIMGGHFMRRYQILSETLSEFGVPNAVREHWLAHTEKLRPAITQQRGSECRHDQTGPRRLPLAFRAPVGDSRRELPVARKTPKKEGPS
jgi:hemoglobin